MELFPAIDLSGGKVVRLFKGDYNRMTVYDKTPGEMARLFKEQGAKNLHVVDLDGAKDGTAANFSIIKQIADEGGLFIEVGGGIRSEERIKQYLALGVQRVILGTAALKNQAFLKEMVQKYGDKIAVGVDAKNGLVAVNGWTQISTTDSFDFCRALYEMGVKTVIYTDISKDGAMQGTNLEAYKRLAEIKGLDIVASGGISFIDELKTLKENGTYGAILGKALYENKLSLEECLKVSQ